MYTVTCELKGGLGNQLFQIFNLISYSINHNMIFKFPKYKGMFSMDKKIFRPNYLNSFLVSQKNNITDINNFHNITESSSFKYKNLNNEKNKNIKLIGYFQSFYYFEKNFDLIKKILLIDDIIEQIKKKNTIKPKSISIHFRIGDYSYCNIYPIMQSSYYINSIKHIINEDETIENIYYFYEKNDFDKVNTKIKKIKNAFPNLNFININMNHDWEEMILMSLCNHNVIANSTFSWWAAYLNSNNNKIVCYPDKWIYKKKLINEHLFPKNWIIINS